MKNKILVEVCDKEYALVTDESEEYVVKIAALVDKQINDTIYRNIRAAKIDAAILACLDLCDRNLKLAESNDNMRMQIAEFIEEIASLKRQLAKCERLSEQNDQAEKIAANGKLL